MASTKRLAAGLIAAVLGLATVVAPSPVGAAVPRPGADPFYAYSGSVPLSHLRPGTVLKRRVVTHHITGIAVPQKVTQLLYRTRDTLGAPATTVATVIPPLARIFARPRLVSYQFAYDALGDQCDPSYAYSGGVSVRGGIDTPEQAAVLGYLLAGFTVVVSDYEGENLHFGAGREAGMQTLDGIRAAENSGAYGVRSTSPVAMVGYSGGSIATEWAAEQAPRYAPEVDRHLVGAAMGGTPTDLEHLLSYIDGSPLWAGAIPLGLVGLARAYRIDLDPYTSAYGKRVLARVSDECITDVVGRYAGLRFADLMKPQYNSFAKIPPLAAIRPQVVMGKADTPTTPLLFAVGKLGATGDGIVVTQDVKNLAADYCRRGAAVQYRQYTGLEHVTAMARFMPEALTWVAQRFGSGGRPAAGSCAGL